MMKRILFLFLLFTVGCTTLQREGILVVTTVQPLHDIAAGVGHEFITVKTLIPPGADPHSWEPRPSDIFLLQEADLVVYVGELEPWIETMDIPQERLFRASDHLELHEDEAHDHHADPHFWFDITMDITIAGKLSARLSGIAPSQSSIFSSNAEDYIEELMDLDKEYRTGLSGCRQDTFVVAGHAAFGYLAERYNLKQLSISGTSPDAQPSPKQLAMVIDDMSDKGISYVFYEELASDRLARSIAEETGAGLLVLDTGVSGDSLQDMMRANLENLRIGLECS